MMSLVAMFYVRYRRSLVEWPRLREQEEPRKRSPARNAATASEGVGAGDEEHISELADRVGVKRR